MTVIGVAGCTALLVTGFGISDSINGIIVKQYRDIDHYDLMTAVTDAQDTQEGAVYDYLFEDEAFTASLATLTEKTTQELPDGSSAEVYMMVPQDVEAFSQFYDLHERVSRKATPLGETGIVMTEKLAELMNVKTGDTVTLADADGEEATFTISGICENYVSNYVYLSASTYTEAFGEEPEWNMVLSCMEDTSQASRDAVSAKLLAMEQVASVTFTVDTTTSVLNMLNSINAVVVMIVICAAVLALVVLYNLTNINIAERVKEIATIKVLGFYDREVNAYVNRESVALTLAGILFGVFAGIALHRFIILTVEVDAVMFGREIAPLSFACAVLLTLLFSTIVNLVMQRTLKKIFYGGKHESAGIMRCGRCFDGEKCKRTVKKGDRFDEKCRGGFGRSRLFCAKCRNSAEKLTNGCKMAIIEYEPCRPARAIYGRRDPARMVPAGCGRQTY